jgi:DNA-binding NarL/FixJ family response regulator
MKSKTEDRSRAAAKKQPAASRSGPTEKRVFVVDDHPMMRDGMARLIDSEPGLRCCGGAKSAEEAIDEIGRCQPDIVITDITLPHRSGIELIKDLKAMYPEIRVVVYSMHDEMLYAERALQAGAQGYLMKEAGSEKMLEVIRSALAGETYVSPRITAKILKRFSGHAAHGSSSPVEKLTDREFEVYQLIGKGKTTKDIAEHLRISPKTVAVHREHIKEKLAIKTAAELTHQAIRWEEAQASGREAAQ